MGKITRRKMSKTAIIFVLWMFLLTILPVYAVVPSEPHAADAMWIEPSIVSLSTATVSVGYRFNVTVWINLTKTSASWEFKLAYNKNHLNATRCAYTAGDKSQFFKNITTLPLSPSFGLINATHDYVLHAESWMMGNYRGPGYGSLSWIEFEVMAIPPQGEAFTSTIAVVDVFPEGTETYAQDSVGNYIALNVFESIYVIPEFPELIIPVALMSLTLVAIILSIKLRSSKIIKMKTNN